MKRIIKRYSALLGIILLLVFPNQAFYGACQGLKLWYLTLVPTLLPFLLFTGIFQRSEGMSYLFIHLNSFLHKIFHLSFHGTYAFLLGLLCGYPMTAHILQEQSLQVKEEMKEGNYLIGHGTLPSMMFVMSYLTPLVPIHQQSRFLFSLYFPVFISVILFGIITSIKSKGKAKKESKISQIHQQQSFLTSIEAAIHSSVTTMILIGIIIMVFSICIQLLNLMFTDTSPVFPVLCGLLELTSGAQEITKVMNPNYIGIFLCFFTSFGGCCVFAQTITACRTSWCSPWKIFIGKIIQGLFSAAIFTLLSIL